MGTMGVRTKFLAFFGSAIPYFDAVFYDFFPALLDLRSPSNPANNLKILSAKSCRQQAWGIFGDTVSGLEENGHKTRSRGWGDAAMSRSWSVAMEWQKHECIPDRPFYNKCVFLVRGANIKLISFASQSLVGMRPPRNGIFYLKCFNQRFCT